MKRSIPEAIKQTRIRSGLPVFDGPLIKATCEECKRAYYWRKVPKRCPWPGCDGKLDRPPNERL